MPLAELDCLEIAYDVVGDGQPWILTPGGRFTKAVGGLTASDGASLATRVGIATGRVVVGELIGEGSAREEAVVGETPNFAARLQVLAEPGTVVVAASTRRLLGSLFELSNLGAHDLKGFSEPVRAWRVVRAGSAERPRMVRPGT